jgi:hypothetical protein
VQYNTLHDSLCLCLQCVYTLIGIVTGLLFRKLPNLKLAVPMEDIKYTDPVKDVGIIELPVKW